MRVIFTCGGTAGHVNPALALAGYMRERYTELELLFVGAQRGLEHDLVEHAGYPFRAVEVSSFHRSLKPREIRHNLISCRNLLRLGHEANVILREFQPDLIVGTGGYASYPMVRYGAKAGIPTAIHESNIVPGLTTKMLARYVDKVMVGFEDCRQHYRKAEKVVVTGTPVRGDFFARSPMEARRELGITDDRPLIVSFWGSLGASQMNRHMVDFFKLESRHEPFHHIHAVGRIGWQSMQTWIQESGLDIAQHPSIRVQEYIYDMATVMRAADLVIARAGASTLSELTALGVPAILVPSPNVTNHHQERNAELLGKHGAALVLSEEEADGKQLFAAAARLLHDCESLARMRERMQSLGIRDATERIYRTVMELVR